MKSCVLLSAAVLNTLQQLGGMSPPSYVCVSVCLSAPHFYLEVQRSPGLQFVPEGGSTCPPLPPQITFICKGLCQPWGRELCVDAQDEISITALPAPAPHHSAKIIISRGARKAQGLCLLQY